MPVSVLGEAVRYANEHLLAEANADASKAGHGHDDCCGSRGWR